MVLKEWDPETGEYTGRVVEKVVGYILKTKGFDIFSKEDVEKYGYQIISLK